MACGRMDCGRSARILRRRRGLACPFHRRREAFSLAKRAAMRGVAPLQKYYPAGQRPRQSVCGCARTGMWLASEGRMLPCMALSGSNRRLSADFRGRPAQHSAQQVQPLAERHVATRKTRARCCHRWPRGPCRAFSSAAPAPAAGRNRVRFYKSRGRVVHRDSRAASPSRHLRCTAQKARGKAARCFRRSEVRAGRHRRLTSGESGTTIGCRKGNLYG